MADQHDTEQIPHQFVIDELQAQLNAKTAELVVAMARIRTRDERISRLEHDAAVCRKQHQGGGGVAPEANAGG